ncbi:tape measure protein [Lysinibacillus pakistanensis]|uniref:tape measure protein n=1 Tax=Lysinibacillus pakistanensis TaxID=759811 RepID=UPI003D28845F
MATIQTAIQIQDRLSQPMRAMHNAVSMMVNQMEAMNAASGHMMDTSSIEIARRELARASEQFNRIESEVRNADNAQQGFNNHIRDGTSAANGLLGKVMGIAAAYLSFQSVKGILSMADDITNTTARLGLMNDGLQTTAELSDKILASANRTYSSFDDTADMIAKLGILAGDAFTSNDEIIAFAEQLNKHFTISGTELQGVQSVMLQLTQAMAGGVLRGEELNSVFENAPTLIQNIADYLKVTKGEIRELASDGKITADIVKRALFAAADETNARFEAMPNTFRDVWTAAMNNVSAKFGEFFNNLTGVSDSKRFQSAVDGFVASMTGLASAATFVIDLLITGGSFVYENWSMIEPVIWAVTAALFVYNSTMGIAWLTTLKDIAAKIWSTAVSWAQTAAILALIVAQDGLNAALYACPLTWIIILVIALIGIFYLAIAVVNHFAGTSYSATGAIAGFFVMLGAVIYNVIAYIWNMWASYIEFFANVSKNKTYAVKRLFYNLATNVLDSIISMTNGWDNFATNFVNAIVSAVNGAIKAWNWFVDLLPPEIAAKIGVGKGSEIAYRTSITSDLKGLKSGLKDWVGEAPADYWEAPKMEMKSLSAAYDTGYNWGANLFGSDKNNNKNNSEKAIEDAMKKALGGKLDKGNKDNDKTAKNTAKMAKKMEGAGEDLKYLRDIAEREAINRYTTAEINIDARSENHINNEMDLDGIIDRFTEKAEEAAEMLAEGGPTEYV